LKTEYFTKSRVELSEDKIHLINNSFVEAGISEECGFLYPVRFLFGNNIIDPMHIAPWTDEALDNSVPPMLKGLRGDFFCAPFGASDLLPDETRGHGASANEKWKLNEKKESSIKLLLSKEISGAELTKEISVTEGQSVIYQKHTFKGGTGRIPVGHHAMLKINGSAFISFSDFDYAGTPPQPVENDKLQGSSILKYPQSFTDLADVAAADGRSVNVSKYPFDSGHEDLYMVISKKGMTFGWSAVSCPSEGWLWFSIKNTDILPDTVVWLSNGGRYYPPFSSRHKNVIGIEETASFFHLGHKASVEDNELSRQGYKTYIDLAEDRILEIPYVFGLVRIPANFGRVKSIVETNNGIEIKDLLDNAVNTNINMNFIRNTK
jgi:hypothetical protein